MVYNIDIKNLSEDDASNSAVNKRIKEMEIKMNEEFKSGFVTIIGRTNVGKSTLINLLVFSTYHIF